MRQDTIARGGRSKVSGEPGALRISPSDDYFRGLALNGEAGTVGRDPAKWTPESLEAKPPRRESTCRRVSTWVRYAEEFKVEAIQLARSSPVWLRTKREEVGSRSGSRSETPGTGGGSAPPSVYTSTASTPYHFTWLDLGTGALEPSSEPVARRASLVVG